MNHLTLPTRELVGLLADVLPFASADDEDTVWHRIVIRWDGARLHAFSGDGQRLAWMSWGPDDGDAPTIPGLDPWAFNPDGVAEFELAITPQDAAEIAKKFKLSPKLGDSPVRVTGNHDGITIERDADEVGTALKATALSRPWDDNAPRIDEAIGGFAASATVERNEVAISGFALSEYVNPLKVRQRGPLVIKFARNNAYLRIGRWFRGAVVTAEVPTDENR